MHGCLDKNKKLAGFSLVEVMVAMVVFSILAAGFFSVIMSSRYLAARSKNRVKAIEVARAEIEKKRGTIDAVSWNATSGALRPTGGWSAYDTTTYAPYRVRYRIDNGPGSAEYRNCTVQVVWDETGI